MIALGQHDLSWGWGKNERRTAEAGVEMKTKRPQETEKSSMKEGPELKQL